MALIKKWIIEDSHSLHDEHVKVYKARQTEQTLHEVVQKLDPRQLIQLIDLLNEHLLCSLHTPDLN